jgi:hypothetical protein
MRNTLVRMGVVVALGVVGLGLAAPSLGAAVSRGAAGAAGAVLAEARHGEEATRDRAVPSGQALPDQAAVASGHPADQVGRAAPSKENGGPSVMVIVAAAGMLTLAGLGVLLVRGSGGDAPQQNAPQ